MSSPMPTDVIAPYQGPPATPENFTQAFPEVEHAVKQGVNRLDPESQNNLNELIAYMRSNPPKPATVVNLHPWPLMFPAGNRLLRGLQIAPCQPGELFKHTYIRGWRRDWEYNENGSLKFKAILPIQLAAEFVREFSNLENDGGGVIIYEGEHNPDKVGQVELYDTLGRLVTTSQPSFEYDEENQRHPVTVKVPVREDFQGLLRKAIGVRNQIYMRKVQEADERYKNPDPKLKTANFITPKHRLMAEVLHAEGIISKVPDWNLASRLDEGLSDRNCPACGNIPKAGAYKCVSCGNVLNPLAAYKDFAIEFEHSKMAMLTPEEMEVALKIKAERDGAAGHGKKQR